MFNYYRPNIGLAKNTGIGGWYVYPNILVSVSAIILARKIYRYRLDPYRSNPIWPWGWATIPAWVWRVERPVYRSDLIFCLLCWKLYCLHLVDVNFKVIQQNLLSICITSCLMNDLEVDEKVKLRKFLEMLIICARGITSWICAKRSWIWGWHPCLKNRLIW